MTRRQINLRSVKSRTAKIRLHFTLYSDLEIMITLASWSYKLREHQCSCASGPKSSSCMVYKVLHGCAPSYLGPFTYVVDLPSRRGLRSSCSDSLVQPPVHRSTVGSRAFSVAGPHVWNCLPPEVTSAPCLVTFRTRLETFLFTESYPDIRLI